MIRLSCVHQTIRAFTRLSSVHVQTFVRSPESSSVHDQTFVCSSGYSCVHDQAFVSSPVFRALISRLLCVLQNFVRSCSDFRAFNRLNVQYLMRPSDYSCVHIPNFERSPDFCSFIPRLLCVHQTFVGS